MCSDASLEDGEMERITALEIDPEVYYALLEDPGSEESPEEDVAQPVRCSLGRLGDGQCPGVRDSYPVRCARSRRR